MRKQVLLHFIPYYTTDILDTIELIRDWRFILASETVFNQYVYTTSEEWHPGAIAF